MNMSNSGSFKKKVVRRASASPTAGRRGFQELDAFEALEPRLALSAYSFASIFDQLGYSTPRFDLAAPAGSGAAGFGAAMSGLGDINGDGVVDFAVGAPGSADPTVAGRVFIYSGATGAVMRTLMDGSAGFGGSLADLGDVNGDGVPDLLVGSPRYDGSANGVVDPTGAAWVYSGADGSVLHTLVGDNPFDEFGAAVGALSRANGPASIIVGAPGAGGTGRVYVFAGDTAGAIATFSGEAAGERFGAAIAAAPAWAGFDDSAPMLAIGAPSSDNAGSNAGRVVLIGRAGQVISSTNGMHSQEELGASVAFLQNAFRNGYFLLAGAPGSTALGLANVGSVRVIPPIQGTVSTLNGREVEGARFGAAMSIVGDLTGDGIDDVMISAPGSHDRVLVVASPRFDIDYSFSLTYGIPEGVLTFGGALGDLNDDGITEFLTSDGNGRVTVMSSAQFTTAVTSRNGGTSIPRVSGATPDGHTIWINGGSRPMIIRDGVITPYSRIPGFLVSTPDYVSGVYSEILGVGPGDEILYHNIDPQSQTPEQEPRLMAAGGGDSAISSLFMTVDGGPDHLAPVASNLYSAQLSLNGRYVLLRERLPQNVSNRIWLLDLNTGALVFLWDGVGADVNSSGMVVGSYGNGPAGAVVRSPSGDINVFPDLGSGLAVSESGDVLGFITVGVPIAHFAVRSGGMVTDIGVPTIEGNQPSWTILDFDDAHRVIVEATVYDPLGPPVNDDLYVTTPDQGWALISDITHGQGATPVGHRNSFESSGPISATFRDDGTIATYTGILTPVSDQSVWTLRPGSPIATVGGAEGDSIAGINVYNELVVIRNTLNGRTSVWTGRRLYVGALTPAAEIVAYTDPMDGDKEFVAVADTNFGRSFSVQGNSGIDLTPDLTHLTVFTTGDGVVVLVGVDPRAHLQMMFHGSFGPWTQVDLTETHFQPQGLPTPHFVSGFSAFVTPWGSDHFVGLDDQGHAEVVWWASGMTLWRVDDLTASVGSGAPTLTGRLTAFATPWGTLHVNGVDAQGEMTSIWWAPSFGSQWTASRLLPGGLALDPATLDSYVTAWGGLTISGIDRQGRIAVYWWSSESDGWHAEAIAVRPPPASLPALDITARPAARAVGSSSQAIAAAGADGHVLRYSWTVGDADLWNLTDITAQT